MKDKPQSRFVVFPTMGYWEIDGNPVSSEDARAVGYFSGGAKWIETEVARDLKTDTESTEDE